MKKWKAPNGNVCFRLLMHRKFERAWIIISAILIAIVICGIGFFVWGVHSIQAPIMVFLLLFFLLMTFLWWINIPTSRDEAFVENTVYEIMDKAVDEDAKAVGAKVARRLVNHDCKGTYGIVEASCLLVLLDNEEVWEYPLYYKPDEHGAYFECERSHVVSENQKHIRKINPKRWRCLIGRLNLSEKTRLGLLLVVILVVGGLSFAGLYWVFENFIWWLLLVFGGYASVYSLTEWLYSRCPSKFLNVIRTVISVPFVIVYLLFQTVFPFITIVGTYFIVGIFAFGLPALILTGFSYLGWFVLKPETMAFIVFTMGSIICTNSYRTTKWIIHQSPLRDWGNHTYETYVEALAVYLIHPSNVIFLLYLVYLVFLGVSGFLQIENGTHLISNEYDSAILKAFLVFIAFTNMRTKSKEVEVDAKELFLRTMKLFVHDRDR